MVGQLLKTLMAELEVPIEIDKTANNVSIQVNETQSVDFSRCGDKGYTMRAMLGKLKLDQDIDELYMEAGLRDAFDGKGGQILVSVDTQDRGYLTLTREEELSFADFKEDFEIFLNGLDYWTKRWTGA
ncbi:MAG: type III secretion system chaperone [Chlamydiia bacterium]|nr:type III secretion system chaperone [Chlamydiia bacterium]